MFIEILEQELQNANLSMNKLAQETGIKQSTLASWKKGAQPSIDKLVILCNYFKKSADEFLELKPKPPDILTEQEKRLLKYFQLADARGQEYILETAEREASRGHPETERLSNLNIE